MAVDFNRVQAESTIGTFLYFGETKEAVEQLCRIKTYPNLWGTPNNLETTDLECESQTFVPGVKQAGDSSDFTCNYNSDVYEAVLAKANKEGYYELRFGDKNGKNGRFGFYGQHTIALAEGAVNAVREMTVSVTKSSDIEKLEPITGGLGG